MEVNQKHPIKVAFCELAKRYANSGSYQSMSPEQKAIRNRWNLAYTLFKNPVLKRERKSYVKEERFYRAGKMFVYNRLATIFNCFQLNLKKNDR